MAIVKSLKSPVWWQRLQWVLDPVKLMEKSAQQYPDLFSTRIIPVEGGITFVNHPDAIRTMLTSDRQELKAPANSIFEILTGTSSLVSLEGEKHRKERKLLMPSFHGERMHNYGSLIQEITREVFANFSANQQFIARDLTQRISLQVILQAVFGIYSGERYQEIARLVREVLTFSNSPIKALPLFFESLRLDLGKWSFWGSFLDTREKLDNLIYQEIRERRQTDVEGRKDILSLMMSAEYEDGEKISDQQLRDELMLLLLAGHDTTAIAMSWALYWIHRYPEVKAKLLEELKDANFDDPFSIYKLPYLTAVCQETLRIYPVAMLTFPREVVKPIELLDYKFDSGMLVMGCIYLLHQREDLYPSPHEFKPERFLERQYSPYEFMPFGNGARRCIGDALAQYEMKLAIATILTNYELTLAETKPLKPVRRGFVLNPQGGVKMIFNSHLAPMDKQ